MMTLLSQSRVGRGTSCLLQRVTICVELLIEELENYLFEISEFLKNIII